MAVSGRFVFTLLCCVVSFQHALSACPGGWLTVGTGTAAQCYRLFPAVRQTFAAAQSYCAHQQPPGYLARDLSTVTHAALKTRIASARTTVPAPDSFWFGLTDNNTNNGPWRWDKGPVVGTYRPFFTNFNNTLNRLDCGYLVTAEADPKWHVTTTCAALKAVICQVDFNAAAQITTRPTTPAPVFCPGGWTVYQQKRTCLQLNTNLKTWPDARGYCKANGGDLVKIADSEFNGFVNGLVTSLQGDYWIGLNDQRRENAFGWLDETTTAAFTSWAPGEPNNANQNENCASLSASRGYKWNDAPCDTLYRFICQHVPLTNGVTPVVRTTPPSVNCGAGWEEDPNSDNCYQININMMSWTDAQTTCQTAGGQLASINSVEEQFFLSARSMSYAGNMFWIGANDRATEKGWQWINNSPFGFLNWDSGQPNNAQESDCAVMIKSSGRWDDLPCNNRYGFICKKKGRVTLSTPRPASSPAGIPADKMWGCPGGWTSYGVSCYAMFSYPDGVTFSDASTFCSQKQATLASIANDAENRYIFSQITRGYNDGVWIGLNDQKRENSFEWTDNSLVTYTNWNPGEPNNVNQEDCVTMLANANGKWNDATCDSKYKLIACKQGKKVVPKNGSPEQQGCPANSIGYGASCYSYNDAAVNYNQAKAACVSKSGTLATVDNVQIQSFLAAELFGKTIEAYWIGLSATSNVYRWVSNVPFSFTSWSNTHTGNANEANTCVGMQTARPTGLWVNYNCGKTLPYICETRRTGFTTPRTTPSTTPTLPCPAGWTARGSLCYMPFIMPTNATLPWASAKDYCASRASGGTLISIPNSAFETWVRTTLLKNTAGTYWIGLNDRDTEAGYKWTDGSGVTYTNWAPNQPDNMLNSEDCVQWALPANKWNDNYCYVANSFICQAPRGAVVPTTRPTITPGHSSAQCGNSSWTLYNNFCYFVSAPGGDSSLASWFDARLTCKNMGAELASIASDDENGYITTMVSQNPVDSFWIGLNDLDLFTYGWTDLSPVSYIHWGLNQPDDAYGAERCVEIGSTGYWNDNFCQEKRGFVCKKRLNGYTPPTLATPSLKGGCPSGFHSLPSLRKCFAVGGTTPATRKTFEESFKACELMVHKSTLASIHSNLEEKFLITLIADLTTPAWIGLNDRKTRNQFGWMDNQNVDFVYWGLRQPDENLNDNNPNNRRDCVDMELGVQTIGKWDDKRCLDKYAYICESNKGEMLPTEAPNIQGCPNGYTRFRSSCYRFYAFTFNWTDAEGYCVAEGGHLVSLDSVAEQAFIEILTQKIDAVQMWVGLRFTFTTQGFAWSDGWPVAFTNWGQGQPALTGMDSCASHTIDGQWQDVPCVMQLNFVCEQSLVPPPTPKPTIPVTLAACPDRNWQLNGAYCYYFEKRLPKTWPGANYACRMLGAVLLTIHTDDEARYLTGLVTSSHLDSWIGLNRGEGHGFAWADSSPLEYLFWDMNEPSDPEAAMHQDCVKMSRQNGMWSDTNCFDNNAYICKMPSSLATTQTTQSAVITTNAPAVQSSGGQIIQSTSGQVQPVNTNGPATSGQVVTSGGDQNKPITSKYTSDSGGSSGLSGGSIAGIVIGCLAIIAVTVVVIFVAMRYFNLQSMFLSMRSSPSSGFDNATYSSGDKVKLSVSDA
ncbi:macrophage mannose receptor 1-like [Physella acuta]|uniref:macrophage mannose receptor 1-like n=1 Tax=Physella acuta TaxID=109671 RepID=UPI0027DC646F|nr:macrophage mannose receptor 1-like [Physella acuta]